jgi:hypothetical protein
MFLVGMGYLHTRVRINIWTGLPIKTAHITDLALPPHYDFTFCNRNLRKNELFSKKLLPNSVLRPNIK